MTPARAGAHAPARAGALILIVSSLALAGCVDSVFRQSIVTAPTNVSRPAKINVSLFSGAKRVTTVVAAPVIVQFDRSQLISKNFETSDVPVLKISNRDTRVEISVPAMPQFVQIESARGFSTSNELVDKSILDKCGPTSALNLLSQCTRGRESFGQWKWSVAIPPNLASSPYLVVYVRWVTNQKKGPPVIYLGLWALRLERAS
jgi:hypothetical protein